MSKRFLIVLAVILVGVGAIFMTTKKKNSDSPPSNGDTSAQLSQHTIGSGKSGVTFTEYGDFQCPVCYRYEPIMRQVREKYKDQITFQFRHFPLSEIHKNAVIASRAAEAAGLQGKFWEMHDKLYETQDPRGQTGWVATSDPTNTFVDYAQQLGLNVDKFKEDIKSDAVNRTVQADRAEAKRLGFNGTPSFALDGKPLDNVRDDLSVISKILDDAIAAKQKQ